MADLKASAVVYGKKGLVGPLNRGWLDEALVLLSEYGLPARQYEINETPTSKNEDLYAWPEDQDRLFRELEGGHVHQLGLYAHSEGRPNVAGWWEGLVFVNLYSSYVFLGLPAASAGPLPGLLGTVDRLASLIGPLPYGVAYLLPSHNDPKFYAIGIESTRTSDPREQLPHATKLQLSKWQDEYLSAQRHLRGWFRDVYPANLLSEAHVRATLPGGRTLEALGIGRLYLLGPGKWLWEVADEDIPRARAVLRDAGRLICA